MSTFRAAFTTTGSAVPDIWPFDLGTAIVHRACVDYLILLRGRRTFSHSPVGNMHEIEQFFHSKWFRYLCDADGEAIIDALRVKNQAGEKTIHYGVYVNN